MLLFRLLITKEARDITCMTRSRLYIYRPLFGHLSLPPTTPTYQWPVQNKLLVNLPVARRLVNNWLPSLPSRRLVKLLWVPSCLAFSSSLKPFYRLPLVVWRSPIVSGPELSLFVKFVVIKNPPNCLFANSPFNDLFVKLLRTSRYAFSFYDSFSIHWLIRCFRLISASNRRPSWLYRKLLKHTLSHCSRIPTWLPSTLSV